MNASKIINKTDPKNFNIYLPGPKKSQVYDGIPRK